MTREEAILYLEHTSGDDFNLEEHQIQNRLNAIQFLLEENQELKKQLEENKDKINWYENFEINKTIDKLRIKHNNQQKEFIEYLEDESKEIYRDGGLRQNIFRQILQKYKSIIGVLDEKEN